MRLRSVSFVIVLALLVSVPLVCGDSSDEGSDDDLVPTYPVPPYDDPADPYDDKDDDSQDDDSSNPIEPKPTQGPLPPTDSPTPAPLPPTTAPTPLPTNPPTSTSNTFSMKIILVGTSSTDSYFLAAKLTLDSVGAPYDTLFVGSTPELTTANGAGKYGGIINAASTSLETTLSEALHSYQLSYGVRMVVLYATPEAPGMQQVGTAAAQTMSFKITDASFSKGVQLSFSDAIPFGFTAAVLDALVATPIVTGKLADGSETAVAAVIQHPDGAKTLEFYIPPTVGAGYSLAFGNIWLQWVSAGVYAGLRRMIWGIQIDDLFLSTGIFDPATGTTSGAPYRCTPDDLINLENVIALVNEYVPGSNLRAEFAFNGAGVQLGGGVTADPLYLEAKKRINSFFFESHTFTHPTLDAYTYDQTLAELTPNIELAQDFFGTTNSTASYSSSAMVTPSISGLFNGEVLRALAAVGITSVVGDNSRPELVPSNKYHGIYTSAAVHGFDGIYIVPRQVSDIFYDVSTPAAEVAQYTNIYGKSKTIHEIMIIQAQESSRLLLSYRHDPFMFHQANLGSYWMTLGGKLKVTSLLNMWIANTFSQITRFSNLPIWSFRHEELAELWKQREARDNCGVDVQAVVANAQITGLKLLSTNTCRYALTGINAQPQPGISTEVYGPDITTWVDLTPGVPLQLTLTSPVSL